MSSRPAALASWRRTVSAALCSITLAACGDDPSVPSAAAATGAISSTATVASSVATIPAIKVTDDRGRAVKNVQVRWRVTSGGGDVVNDSIRTNASGEASSGGWKLGTVAGTQTLTASADGVPTVTFTAEAAAGAAARLVVAGGAGARAVVGTALATPPSVRVEDEYGNPVAGVPVTFAVLAGEGVLQGAQQTSNAQGIATLGAWQLGTRSGEQLLRATSIGLMDVAFIATADAGPAVDLAPHAGTTQVGITGERAPSPLAVRVVDQYGNAAAGSQVTFTPAAGSGTVSAAAAQPDPATGVASVVWTLGTLAEQSVVATTASLPGKRVTFRATGHTSAFNIDVRFVGDGGTPEQREAFVRAAVRWRRILSGNLHSTRLNVPAGDCESWVPAFDELINDLVVYVRLRAIDGPGRTLAQAGPCYVNTSTRLPAMGLMEFDTDDMVGMAERGTLEETVVHELGHVLGIGTLWSYQRTLLTGRGTDDPYYVGSAGRIQFNAIGGGTYGGTPVPVENTGGSGTRDSHWRFSIFGNELMQGWEGAPPAPLSAVTAASLADLGYPGVLITGADTYRIGMAAFYASPVTMRPLVNDIADIPLIEVAPDGTRRTVRTKGQR